VDKVERLNEEIKNLKAKLDRCFEKRLLTDDPEKEIDLETLENKLEEQIKQKERERNQLSETTSSRNQKALNLEEGLCYLDFDEPKQFFQAIMQKLIQNEGGSALFLMESCLEMEGRLLLRGLKDILKESTSQFLEYPVEFLPTMPASRITFLKALGRHLGLAFESDFEEESEQILSSQVKDVVEKISELLRSGTTVLIPLTNWQSLDWDYQAVFLEWFLVRFWKELVNAVTLAMEDYSPKVFCVIMVDETMAETCKKADYFCDGENFDRSKILTIPLYCWTQDDVRRWLGSYSSKLKKSERNRLVKSIFGEKQQEIPLKVRVALEKAYSQSVF
jgi:hypothetical protein